MPKSILPRLKDFLKLLKRILFLPRLYGPVATVLSTIVYHYAATYFDFTVAVGWLWLIMIFGVFVGGLRAGLVCAAWIGAYSYYVLPGAGSLTLQRIAISFVMALLVGWLVRNHRQLLKAMDEFLNGNVARVTEALTITRELLRDWDNWSDADKKELVRRVEDRLGNFLAKIVGFRQIREEIDDTLRRHGNLEKRRRK